MCPTLFKAARDSSGDVLNFNKTPTSSNHEGLAPCIARTTTVASMTFPELHMAAQPHRPGLSRQKRARRDIVPLRLVRSL